HDFFLYHMLRFHEEPQKIYALCLKAFPSIKKETIQKALQTFYSRFFAQQFKRNCMPDGVKVGSICFSPRGDWRMPSDASRNLWLSQVKAIQND
ncbi:MAG: NAD(+) synthase, partial [Faecalicoccus sp.]